MAGRVKWHVDVRAVVRITCLSSYLYHSRLFTPMRMKKAIRTLDKRKQNPKNIRFEELTKVAEAFGFKFSRIERSYHIYTKEGTTEILNFQEDHSYLVAYYLGCPLVSESNHLYVLY